jgi:hypothetical protein
MRTKFWWEDINEGHHLEDLGIDGKILLKRFLKKMDGKLWTGFI